MAGIVLIGPNSVETHVWDDLGPNPIKFSSAGTGVPVECGGGSH